MKDYFLKNIAYKSRADFRSYYMFHNLKGLRTLCVIFWMFNMALRLALFIFPANLTRAHNFPEFNIVTWVHILVLPVFYFTTNYLLKELKRESKATTGISASVLAFSMYIILSGLVSSFIVTYIPSDNLIAFLIALTIIGIIFTFEASETWLLTMLTWLVFTLLLFTGSSSTTEILYNELVCAILLAGFFFISRTNYTYRATHFLQLAEINQKNLAIERASNFQTEVLGMVAHDLRNPIGAVETIAMMMEMDSPDKDAQENINMIKGSCAKARGIIDDLLEVARNENTALFATQKTELNQLMRSIVSTWRMPKNTNNSLLFKSTTIPAFAEVNIEKFQRVMDNLISNASKFSKDGAPIDILIDRNGSNIVIEVKDHGVGIPPSMLSQIFDRFSKAGRTGLRGEQSTGLGLSIVQQIIEKHKGKIEVQSEVGKGSTFRIFLPAVD